MCFEVNIHNTIIISLVLPLLATLRHYVCFLRVHPMMSGILNCRMDLDGSLILLAQVHFSLHYSLNTNLSWIYF